MTVRRGSLYLGVFLLAAGGVTLLNASGALDPAAVADAIGTFWPLAVIAVGVGLVLRRSPAALPAGILAAATPGLVFGGMVVAGPSLPVPCTDGSAPTQQAETREGSFGSAAAVDLTLSCGELSVTTAPGNAWRLDARDGAKRRTDVELEAARLVAGTNDRARGWNLHTGRVDWDVILPTGTTLDLTTEINAGRGRLGLQGARLGRLDLAVNAADLRVDLTDATLTRLDLELNAGAAVVTLPAASFEGDLDTNAGSLDLCTPDQLGLRVRSTVALGSIDANGLVRRGDAWETPGYDSAPFKADLAIDTSVGSVTINPEGGCK